MSWSVSGIGKPEPLLSKLTGELGNIECEEPEETIKNLVASILEESLSAFPKDFVVDVQASGSQWQPDRSKPEKLNTLNVTIKNFGKLVE